VQGEIFRQRLAAARTERQDDLVRRFFREFFGIHDIHGSTVFPTFEEVLGILEIAEQENESFREWGTHQHMGQAGRPPVQDLHDRMVFLIAQTLNEALRGRATHHPKLLKSVSEQGWLEHTTFISLNYDILIDNAILNMHREYDWDLDYRLQFLKVQMPEADALTENRWHEPREGRSIPLLKLHGSLNWLYCPTCRGLTLTPKQKGICHLQTNPELCRCAECHTLAVPIVIPPTYFKVLSNLYLRQIWHEAEKELLAAERIIFCGYSFPDADVHVRYLLKRAEINRDGDGPVVFIVNEHEEKPDQQRSDEKARYTRFFRDKDKTHYTSLSFQDFAENPVAVEHGEG
jgi:hypothetical protein